MFVIAFLSLVAVVSAGVIQHEDQGGQGGHHGHHQATSYQQVQIENYQPVPIYIKKEHQQLLDHPVLKGHTATNLKLHHGIYEGKHHGGHALASGTHEQAATGHQEDGGHQGLGGYAAQSHGQGLGAYQVAENAAQSYGGQEADYGHQSAGYEQQGAGVGAGAGAGYEHESAGYAQQEQEVGAGPGYESAGYEQQEAGAAAEGGYGQEQAGHGQDSAGYAQQEQDSGYDHEAYTQAVAEHARHQGAGQQKRQHQRQQYQH